jgi:hypothetical protein
MRTMVRIKMQVEAGNRAFQDGSMQKTLMEAIDRLKPESAYFYPEQGVRTALMIIDLKDSSEIPVVAEPFFSRLNASVEFLPVMNADDLKKGLAKVR